MEPSLQNISDNNTTLEFTLSGVDTSIANSLRRIIISNIQCFVFRTSPYEKNDAIIEKNTTRFNNEILKQRLSCIPIHITDPKFPYETYEVEINKTNDTNKIEFITTEDFKIKNTLNNEYLSKEEQKKIFPPNPITKHYIDFARLRHSISDEIPGESLIMKCKISKASGSDDYMYNNVSVCAYGNTMDSSKAESEWNKLEKQYSKDKSEQELQKLYNNYMLLDGKRHFIKNSFDFIIETIGIYKNQDLIKLGCDELIKKFNTVLSLLDDDKLIINNSENTNDNSYDIILENEDYTIGKVIEYLLHEKFFKDTKNKKIDYCGFIKKHPHDNFSIIRIIYSNDVNDSYIKNDIKIVSLIAVELYNKIKSLFI
jgi:DNA-directed RNA polymerase subunit L